MGLLYAITNLLDGDTLNSASSEDTLYVKENLYCKRPSKPFRFTAKTSQWIKADFGADQNLTLVAAFNHNLTNAASVAVEGHASDSWGAPSYQAALTWREHDIYKAINQTYRWYRLTVDDAGNSENPEIGELFLGQTATMSDAYIQPGRLVSPSLHRAVDRSPFGQIWAHSLSDSETMRLVIQNKNDPAQVDAVHAFIKSIHDNGGVFILIPDSSLPHVYMVFLENEEGFGQSIIRGASQELNEWTLELRTLTRGIKLL